MMTIIQKCTSYQYQLPPYSSSSPGASLTAKTSCPLLGEFQGGWGHTFPIVGFSQDVPGLQKTQLRLCSLRCSGVHLSTPAELIRLLHMVPHHQDDFHGDLQVFLKH